MIMSTLPAGIRDDITQCIGRTSGVRPMHCVMSSRIPAGMVDWIMWSPRFHRGKYGR